MPIQYDCYIEFPAFSAGVNVSGQFSKFETKFGRETKEKKNYGPSHKKTDKGLHDWKVLGTYHPDGAQEHAFRDFIWTQFLSGEDTQVIFRPKNEPASPTNLQKTFSFPITFSPPESAEYGGELSGDFEAQINTQVEVYDGTDTYLIPES